MKESSDYGFMTLQSSQALGNQPATLIWVLLDKRKDALILLDYISYDDGSGGLHWKFPSLLYGSLNIQSLSYV